MSVVRPPAIGSMGAGLGRLGLYLDEGAALRRVASLLACVRDGRYALQAIVPRELLLAEGAVSAIRFEAGLGDPSTGRIERRPLLIDERISEEASPSRDRSEPGLFGRLEDHAAIDEETGARIQLSPADEGLHSLAEILSLSFLSDLLSGLADRSEAGRGEVRARVAGHRFGRRLTIHLGLRAPGGVAPLDLNLKVYAGRRDRRPVHALERLSGVRDRLAFRIPSVLHHDPERGLVVCDRIPGRSFFEKMTEGEGFDCGEIGAALRSLHDLVPEGLPLHTRAEEWRLLEATAARVELVRPEIGSEMLRLTEAMRSTVDGIAEGLPVFAHRDFYDKQVILGEKEIGMIDWDSAASAPPALDIGNFLAHLELRSLQGRLGETSLRREGDSFLAGYERGGPCSRAEVDLYERLALLRLAGIYSLRPGWTHLPARLLDAVRGTRGDE